MNVHVLDESPTVRTTLKILLADDHALLRRGLKEFLQDFLAEDGRTPQITETGSAHQAIEQIRAAAWDLVILDLNLPDMPGLEVLRILKSVQPGLPVLVVSIYSEEHYATRAVRAGALGYLTKETGPEELRAAVSRILQGGSYVPSPPIDQPQEDALFPRDPLCGDRLPGRTVGSRNRSPPVDRPGSPLNGNRRTLEPEHQNREHVPLASPHQTGHEDDR